MRKDACFFIVIVSFVPSMPIDSLFRTSSAISQNGFIDIRAPLRSTPVPSGLTRTRAV